MEAVSKGQLLFHCMRIKKGWRDAILLEQAVSNADPASPGMFLTSLPLFLSVVATSCLLVSLLP